MEPFLPTINLMIKLIENGSLAFETVFDLHRVIHNLCLFFLLGFFEVKLLLEAFPFK